MSEQQERIAAALLCANTDSPPMTECPSCGWGPLAYFTFNSGVRLSRSYKCRECGWGQGGPIYSSILRD